MSEPIGICHPDQCCGDGHCVEEYGLHGVSRDTAEQVIEHAGAREDRIIAERDRARDLAAALEAQATRVASLADDLDEATSDGSWLSEGETSEAHRVAYLIRAALTPDSDHE